MYMFFLFFFVVSFLNFLYVLFLSLHYSLTIFSATVMIRSGGGELPYETDGDAPRLA